MDIFTLITIILTVAAVWGLERIYQLKKSSEMPGSPTGKIRARYREEAFEEIIKINAESLQHGPMDSLTGLPGRQIFDERLKRILEHSKKYNQIFSAMILNIDEFHSINLVYGEVFGNKLLAEVANRLRTVLRQIDTVSRYAGDNFFFIVPELSNPEVAVLVAQRIQDSIIQPFTIEDHRIFVTACIGIDVFSQEDENSEKLLINAESALTKAKSAGRNTYRMYNEKVSKGSEYDLSLREYFNTAAFYEKIMMNYQPYVDVKDQK